MIMHLLDIRWRRATDFLCAMTQCDGIIVQWAAPMSLIDTTEGCPHGVPDLEDGSNQLEALEWIFEDLKVLLCQRGCSLGREKGIVGSWWFQGR
jgi:hypothetical protein